MKFSNVVSIAGFCMLSVFVYSAAGKKCYNCLLDDKCKDEFVADSTTDGFLVDCTGSCIKNKNEATGVVHRFCSPVTVNAGCMDQTFDGADGKSCACDGNACNGARVVDLPVISFVMLLVASLFFNLYN